MDFQAEVSALRALVHVLARAVLSHNQATKHQQQCERCKSPHLNPLQYEECPDWERLAGNLSNNMAEAMMALSQHDSLMNLIPEIKVN